MSSVKRLFLQSDQKLPPPPPPGLCTLSLLFQLAVQGGYYMWVTKGDYWIQGLISFRRGCQLVTLMSCQVSHREYRRGYCLFPSVPGTLSNFANIIIIIITTTIINDTATTTIVTTTTIITVYNSSSNNNNNNRYY